MRTRRTRRWTVVLIGAIGSVMLFAPAAQAKGDMVTTSASVVITGPGLSKPIELRWRGSCFAFAQFACSKRIGSHPEAEGFPKDLGQVGGPFWSFATQSNFLSMVSGASGSFRAPADAIGLGPKYHVTWTLLMSGPVAETVQQDLYPYGPSVLSGLPTVPWTFTPGGPDARGEPRLVGLDAGTPELPSVSSSRSDCRRPRRPCHRRSFRQRRRHRRRCIRRALRLPRPTGPSRHGRSWSGCALLIGLIALGARAGQRRQRLQPA